MKEFRGTPGPWSVARAGWTDEGNVWYALEGVKEACGPDARLIAAAPDLLEALQEAMKIIEEIEIIAGLDEQSMTDAYREAKAKMHAAVTKALGS